MGMFSGMRISASALTAERLRMDVISSNIANAQTTRTAEGGAYKRQRVVFRPIENANPREPGIGVAVTNITADARSGNTVHDPNHPDADAQGYVTYPNVDIATEMVDMLSATRAYQANVVALQAAKTIATKALEISQ